MYTYAPIIWDDSTYIYGNMDKCIIFTDEVPTLDSLIVSASTKNIRCSIIKRSSKFPIEDNEHNHDPLKSSIYRSGVLERFDSFARTALREWPKCTVTDKPLSIWFERRQRLNDAQAVTEDKVRMLFVCEDCLGYKLESLVSD